MMHRDSGPRLEFPYPVDSCPERLVVAKPMALPPSPRAAVNGIMRTVSTLETIPVDC
jgi:hypothetical protein